jgi:hypothetical protein
MIITDKTYKTHAGFTVGTLRETCTYLWQVLPHSTGMQDGAEELVGTLNKLDRASVTLRPEEAITFMKAWATDQLFENSQPKRGIAYNSYDMARDRLYHMFLAMTARQYPSLIDAQMVMYSLKYKVDHDKELSQIWGDIFLKVMKDGGAGKSERPTSDLRKNCLSEIEHRLSKGDEEALHGYVFILALFH